MKLDFPLSSGIELRIASGVEPKSHYPTARIQKGLVLLSEGIDLAEEAVGFGVPIVKRSLETIFPSQVDLYLHGGCEQTRISARYKLDLEERISTNGNGSVKNRLVYASKNSLAAVIRQSPFLRKFLTRTSNIIRSSLDWHTTYEKSEFSTYVVLTYTIDDQNNRITVELTGGDFLSASISEVIIMNELGAHYFDEYHDSDGLHQAGDQIGCWDAVTAEEATFVDQTHKISFSLHQVKDAHLFRGRELIEPRLAWSGFGYTFHPELKNISFDLLIGRLP